MATQRRRKTTTPRNKFYSPPTRRRRNRTKMQRTIFVIIALAVVGLIGSTAIGQCRSCNRDGVDFSGNLEHRALEVVVTPEDVPSHLVQYKAMTLSYNPELHLPNWVAWELKAENATGTEPRTNQFVYEPDVKGCAYPEDYRNSGYDRGHMAPAGDMKWDAEAMRQSFLMTNIVPQYPDLNRGTWRRLEEKTRTKALHDSVVYVVAGPIVKRPVEMNIGSSGVAVPDMFFKVIISPYAKKPSGMGFIFPNGPTPGGMQPYAVSIDSVESLTGFDFFSSLPDDLEQLLESNTNFNRWSSNR